MKRCWWKEGVVYQIYPRSFYDSNGDGIGDLRGIIEKLDYLKRLGINIIWLNPVYKSPNQDNGYDISDYQDIMDEFGTLADWEELLAKLHQRGIKLIMDLVVNHTSDEHAWFVESRSSNDNPHRDYYIWRKGKNGNPPNNWASFFQGSAWKYDPRTNEYFLHLFADKQPDLNWENETVRQEVYNMMTWWLEKGIDGFRMDVINLISKVPGLPDVETKKDGPVPAERYFANGPKVHDYLQEMHREVLSKYDIFTVGETPCVNVEDGYLYSGEDRRELQMIFQFEHMGLDQGEEGYWSPREWKLTELKQIMSKWQTGLYGRGWNSLYLNNHDQPRLVSRFGNDREYRVESAKMLGTMLHTLQGTPYIYQGEEIGLTNVAFDDIHDYNDVWAINFYHEALKAGKPKEEILALLHDKGRDNARTPIPWDDSPNGGFTTGVPWLKLNPNYPVINVKQALADEHSVFYYYQKLIKLRKEHLVIVYGDYTLLLGDDEQIWAYVRRLDQDGLLVILNFFEQEVDCILPKEVQYKTANLLLSNYAVSTPEQIDAIHLRPYEARVYKLQFP
ncbi:glucohydrolase [candidate division KSB3 bacterium]|uniref:Glucohydrolase n=1 Tax=candidate division KSB3 bacterium TaxID=2044937 RepID=A0A2G6KB87_9BACT|nr:MAG: glucohydrolase [candidate division KSB3 bacterium]